MSNPITENRSLFEQLYTYAPIGIAVTSHVNGCWLQLNPAFCEMNSHLLEEMLRKLGGVCDIVENGEEAVKALERETYDLLFMDIQMPVMDGIEATCRIRQTHPEIPVIAAITAFAGPNDREACLKCGMQDFISKPFSSAEISRVLSTWVPYIRSRHER